MSGRLSEVTFDPEIDTNLLEVPPPWVHQLDVHGSMIVPLIGKDRLQMLTYFFKLDELHNYKKAEMFEVSYEEME